MFGLKKFNETKTNRFENDKRRKQYFAIRNYYAKKTTTTITKPTKNTPQ